MYDQEEPSNEIVLQNKIKELENRLNELVKIHDGSNETKATKLYKTPQTKLKASNKYYEKMKNNLDFKIKIRDRNKFARDKKKGIKNSNETSNTREEVSTIIHTINKPITISFYDDDDNSIGF